MYNNVDRMHWLQKCVKPTFYSNIWAKKSHRPRNHTQEKYQYHPWQEREEAYFLKCKIILIQLCLLECKWFLFRVKKQIFKKNRLHLVVYFTFLAAFGVFFLHHMSVCCSSRETAINHEIMSQKGVHDGWAVATRGDFSLRLEAG